MTIIIPQNVTEGFWREDRRDEKRRKKT